ncbi:hypothetical protein RN001_003303 [Aquatica leii]|uniref:4-nitrophenylphosphatase n=1 Tax=Aquatica leii TaxID=1421715 RepID=A0AAN7Q9E8_9COLE|nr:hypothetical protein RN001_003303 [Aquatica leii]
MSNLVNLSKEELTSFLNSFDNIFCDVDGVLWPRAGSVISGIKETFSKLDNFNKKVRFVTHNNLLGRNNLHKVLNDIVPGLAIDDVITPISIIITFLRTIKFNKEIFFIGHSASKTDLFEAGFKIALSGPEHTEDSLRGVINNLRDNENIGAVVLDFDPNVNYLKLVKAINYLQREDVLFLSASTGTFATIENRIILGGVMFQQIIEDASGRSATNFGKPSDALKRYLFNKYTIDSGSRNLFVGDTLDIDIKFGKLCGFQTLLVGNFKPENANQIVPDFYINNLALLHKII